MKQDYYKRLKAVGFWGCLAVFVLCVQCSKENADVDKIPSTVDSTGTPIVLDTVSLPDTDTSTTVVADTVSEHQTRTKTSYVYAALNSDKKIAVYRVDSLSGKLHLIHKATTGGVVGSLAISQSGQFLYAALRSTNQVAVYRADSLTGKLGLSANFPVADNPVYITPDKSNKYLLTAYFNAGRIAVYPISNDTVVEHVALMDEVVGAGSHYINTDAQNQYLYVAVMQADRILQYTFNAPANEIQALTQPFVGVPPGTGPRHLAFHPSLSFVYAVNELANTVSKYHYDLNTGLLNFVSSTGTLPAGYLEENTSADIHISPNGKFAYTSNRGHNSIAAFAIDQTSGDLSPIAQYATEPVPREFHISPNGKYLIAGGQASGKLAVYSINDDGTLWLQETVVAGASVSWVLCADL